jgi:hypothetical protein
MILWLLVLVFLPALIMWSPIFAFAYWLFRRGGMRGDIWVWAWMFTATATVVILWLTGFIRQVFGSV